MSTVKKFITVLSMAPAAKPITDPEVLRPTYRYWRIRIFYSVFFGYALFYFCRSNLPIAMPKLLEELQYTKTQLGLIGSSFYVVYAVGKFVNGILDKIHKTEVVPQNKKS